MKYFNTFYKRLEFFVWHCRYVLKHVDNVIEAEEISQKAYENAPIFDGSDWKQQMEAYNRKYHLPVAASYSQLITSLGVVSFVLTLVAFLITILALFS